jgi:hypothetical protein
MAPSEVYNESLDAELGCAETDGDRMLDRQEWR